MNKQYHLIICDVDNTLKLNMYLPTERTVRTIDRLQENGYLFGIASGRPVFQSEKLMAVWGLKYKPDCMVGMNGCELYDEETKEFSTYNLLSRKEIKEILDYVRPFADKGNVMIYYGDHMLFQKPDEIFDKEANKYAGLQESIIAKDESEFYSQPNAKVLFRLYDEADMPLLEEYNRQHPSEHFIGFKTQPWVYEFSKPNVSKATAMLAYAQTHGLTADQIAAFGDTSNDNDMLLKAGLGVCLLNGSDDTKGCADVITEDTCADDGWAKWIEKYIFEEEERKDVVSTETLRVEKP